MATRILLAAVADEFRSGLAAHLEREGAHVALAGTGAQALSAVKSGFDLIILDLDLPDLDGLSVLRNLRTRSNGDGVVTPPVLLLKGEGEPSHLVQRGFDFGASGYLIKHRLPVELGNTKILDQILKALSPAGTRRDVCPFSSRREFGQCSVYLPLSITVGDGGPQPLMSCSHLRVGTANTWRLYPRCAIGDQVARDHYLEDKTTA